jgi:hypothetical protein
LWEGVGATFFQPRQIYIEAEPEIMLPALTQDPDLPVRNVDQKNRVLIREKRPISGPLPNTLNFAICKGSH